jgi:hypothetical protein
MNLISCHRQRILQKKKSRKSNKKQVLTRDFTSLLNKMSSAFKIQAAEEQAVQTNTKLMKSERIVNQNSGK